MIVREHIDFERHDDPFRSLGIGKKIVQLSKRTGMTTAELRITKSRMSNLFRGIPKYRDFTFWLKIWAKDPASHSIDKTASVYDDIVWADANPTEAFELLNLNDSEMYESKKVHFERGGEGLKKLRIGKRHRIEEWLEQARVGEYNIDDDFRIWTKENIILQDTKELFPDGKLPEYINFISTGDFDVDDNGLVSFAGFPEYVAGYLSCQMNSFPDLEGFPKEVVGPIYFYNNYVRKFTEDEIRSVCNAKQNIENDFSDDV